MSSDQLGTESRADARTVLMFARSIKYRTRILLHLFVIDRVTGSRGLVYVALLATRVT